MGVLFPSRSSFRLGVEPRRRRHLFLTFPALTRFLLRILCVFFELDAMKSLSLSTGSFESNTIAQYMDSCDSGQDRRRIAAHGKEA